MKLETDLWLEGAYYIDRNRAGELRVVGPGNHLYYGGTGLGRTELQVGQASLSPEGELILQLQLNLSQGFLPDPAMGHIRRVREQTHRDHHPDLSFDAAEQAHPGELQPNQITVDTNTRSTRITYLRRYGSHYYGTVIELPTVSLHRDKHRRGFGIDHTGACPAVLTTIADAPPEAFHGPLLEPLNYSLDKITADTRRYATQLLDRTAAEIDHLVRHGKTSGFEYGTVFPRDWMETADLLGPDLTPAGRLYMYARSLTHVNDTGAGWHEDIVGEYKYERNQELAHLRQNFDDLISRDHPGSSGFRRLLSQLDELFIRRHMIDIEPRYLLGLRHIPPSQFDTDSLSRLRYLARFVVHRATTHDLIVFNKRALPFRRTRGDDYYVKGNWRDSDLAFKQIHPVIAPFDVNVVFYPAALRIILEHHELLGIDRATAAGLVAKWDRVREWFRFTNDDGIPAFALALYNVRRQDDQLKYEVMRVNHLDEASDQFYGEPSEADTRSFATRLLEPRYFYTASGPILVGHGEGYDHSYYHGEVIWAKQAAYAVAGLQHSLIRGHREHWSDSTLDLIQSALITTAQTCLRAFQTLGAIPEVHYDDHGRPRLYTDQPAPEGVMNKIQLWSAAGARRILRSYVTTNSSNPVLGSRLRT
jgi:hypothetical protein